MARKIAELSVEKPKYEQIHSILRSRIEAGSLVAGARLPGEAKLAEQFGVSALTARQALQRLQNDGLVKRYQGRGTFVSKTGPGTGKAVSHLMFLFVDSSPDLKYNLDELLKVEQFLVDRKIGLSCASLSLEDAINNRMPQFIEDGQVDGVLLDGWVTDFHCYLMDRLNLPYIVVGNHCVSKHIPQIKEGCASLLKQAVKLLKKNYNNIPVWMILDAHTPRHLYYEDELISSYRQTVEQMGQPSLVLFDRSLSGSDILERIPAADHKHEQFAIISSTYFAPRIFQACRKRGIDLRENPLVVLMDFEAGTRISTEEMEWIYRIPLLVEDMAPRGAALLLDMIQSGTKQVCEEILQPLEVGKHLKDSRNGELIVWQ
ncbi:MAG: GntR family transcriptional regulator [Planctomycetota bacterium]